MLVLSLTHHLKGTNSSALEVFNPLFLDFLGTATMFGLRLRLELMSLTKRRTEYYLIKRKSISLLRVKTSSLVEGGVRVCGDAVLRYFWCGFAVIFILTRGIAVSKH